MKYSLVFVLTCISVYMYAQFPVFESHEIGVYGDRMGQTALIDLDKDGDLDWIFGNRGQMWWYEYKTADDWIFHDLGQGAKTDVGGCAADLNNDGLTDFMVGTGWYENTGFPKSKLFKYHPTGTISCHDNVMTDIDGDGIDDVLANSNDTLNPYFVWYKVSGNPYEKWAETIIADGIHGGIDPKGAGDLDMDEDVDLVRGDSWFENLQGDGSLWKEHKVLVPQGGSRVGTYGLAIKTWVTDLDKDGDLDIVEAECDVDDTRVFWWENVDNGKEFFFHLISRNSTGQDFHSLAVADFDNDGDEDVFSGGGPMTQGIYKWFIWENNLHKGQGWKEHVILEDYRCHEAKAADVDGDGDIDICSKPWHGNVHVFLENKLID